MCSDRVEGGGSTGRGNSGRKERPWHRGKWAVNERGMGGEPDGACRVDLFKMQTGSHWEAGIGGGGGCGGQGWSTWYTTGT